VNPTLVCECGHKIGDHPTNAKKAADRCVGGLVCAGCNRSHQYNDSKCRKSQENIIMEKLSWSVR